MSAVPADETTIEHVQREGFGHRLRLAREARGLELMDVANALHLTRAMVHSMEEEDHARLPASVFVRGYLRNYARLVGVPVDAILEAYQGARPRDPFEEREIRIHRVKDEMRSSHGVVRFMSWAVALGILVLLGVWWWGYIDRNGPFTLPDFSFGDVLGGGESLTVSPAPAAVAYPPAASGRGLSPPISATPPLPTSTIRVGPQPAQEPPAATAPPQESEVEAGPGLGQTGDEVVAPAEEGADLAASEPPSAEGPATVPKVVLSLTETSWVDVRDASGKSVLIGQYPKGQRHELQGTPPFKFHLGKASAVAVTVGGEPFNVTPYISKNVARFTIDPRP